MGQYAEDIIEGNCDTYGDYSHKYNHEEWIVTDPDCNQRYRQISKFVFEFEEERIFDLVTKATCLYTEEIDLESYTPDEIVDYCSSFGYPEDEVLEWITNGRNLALIAECIFEMSS